MNENRKGINEPMNIVEFLVWFFLQAIFWITGLVIAKAVVLVWRLAKFFMSKAHTTIGPVFTEDDRKGCALRSHCVVGFAFWAACVIVLVL